MEKGELYRSLTEITEDYLGPAAERFIARQITSHLHKDPQDITTGDLGTLVEWTRVTFSLITEDQQVVEEYIDKMLRLGEF